MTDRYDLDPTREPTTSEPFDPVAALLRTVKTAPMIEAAARPILDPNSTYILPLIKLSAAQTSEEYAGTLAAILAQPKVEGMTMLLRIDGSNLVPINGYEYALKTLVKPEAQPVPEIEVFE